MSENEIKPVLRYELDIDVEGDGWELSYAVPIGREHPEGEWVMYSDHKSAIDRLTDERDAARYDAGANSSVVATLQQERLQLIAERDAAVADAERYRALIEYALAQHNGHHSDQHNHWAAKAMSELADIDAARAQESQG